jgi:aspartate ammonia-lyase
MARAPLRAPAHVPLVHLRRGGMVEGVHHGSAVVLSQDGSTLVELGDVDAACYPRSAAKPLQAVAMVRLGLSLPDDLLALAAASHSGEANHLDGARRILEACGLTEGHLGNPPDRPLDVVEREAWGAAGRPARRLAHNCSGKHAAMLNVAARQGWTLGDYLDPTHPLQREIAATIEELTGEDIAHTARDGCGAPLFAVSLRGLARAAGRLAAADEGTAEHRVARAMRTHPEMVGGSRRDVTELMRTVPGLVAKDGFEAVQIAALADGTAIALKIADGADRARLPVTLALLARAGADPALLAPLSTSTDADGLTVVPGLAAELQLAPDPATTTSKGSTVSSRIEHDLLGEMSVPGDAYWGVHTARACENFPITGTPISAYPHLIDAFASVKEAAARANADLGLLSPDKTEAIAAACREIRAGALHDEFVVDVIQGGAGTSTNMNANEVIANRALELVGHRKGDYAELHPNEHVNLSQSTNDAYPTAVNIATILAVHELSAAMAVLEQAFAAKSTEFRDIVKMGRTQLQDAVPMTLGQEFGTYAVMLGEDRLRLDEAVTLLHEINLGATAIGTGLNTPPGYAETVCRHLVEITGLPLTTASDLVEATQDCGAFVHLSGVLKRVAVKLSKSCNDLRLLSSGPRAGLNEINLPPMQAGSSIMPGKINPVIPEVVNQVAFEVIGNDMTVTMAAEAGQLQLNAFEPIILHSLAKSVTHLRSACLVLAERCVSGITANEEVTSGFVEHSIGLVTALNPAIGYAAATGIAQEALASGRGIAELVLERKLISPERLAELLQPDRLARPGSPVG